MIIYFYQIDINHELAGRLHFSFISIVFTLQKQSVLYRFQNFIFTLHSTTITVLLNLRIQAQCY